MAYTLILRHADRVPIREDLSTAFTAELTLRGILRCDEMSKLIRSQFDKMHCIYTSIAPRCYSTGVLLGCFNSAGITPPIVGERSKYGDFSGGYLKEGMMDSWLRVVADDLQTRQPYSHLMRKWVESGLAHLSRDEYAEHILSRYLQIINVIAVTHDTNLAPIAEYLSEKYGFAFTEEMYFPQFLSGLCLLHENGEPSAIKWIRQPPLVPETQALPLIETLWEKKSG
ncbi:MAG: hypothetical protein QXU54_01290 [Candidatus Micrarchaeia archaeon]